MRRKQNLGLQVTQDVLTWGLGTFDNKITAPCKYAPLPFISVPYGVRNLHYKCPNNFFEHLRFYLPEVSSKPALDSDHIPPPRKKKVFLPGE